MTGSVGSNGEMCGPEAWYKHFFAAPRLVGDALVQRPAPHVVAVGARITALAVGARLARSHALGARRRVAGPGGRQPGK